MYLQNVYKSICTLARVFGFKCSRKIDLKGYTPEQAFYVRLTKTYKTMRVDIPITVMPLRVGVSIKVEGVLPSMTGKESLLAGTMLTNAAEIERYTRSLLGGK